MRSRRLGPRCTPALLVLACACAPVARPRLALLPARPPDAAALQAAEAFHAAAGADGLRQALRSLGRVAPESALYHEAAATVAHLELRTDDCFEHLLAALRDPAGDAPLLNLARLWELPWTGEQRRRAVALLSGLQDAHPSPEVRAHAAWLQARLLWGRGDPEGSRAARRALGLGLDLAVIGPFDNDQGKGYDAVYPPEEEIDISGTYHGSRVDVRWRPRPPRAPDQGVYELEQLFTPTRWSVAYAVGAVEAPAAGAYELRIGSTDPLKVWVNGTLVFEAERLADSLLFDQLVLPVQLVAGANRVLLKSAQRTGSWRLHARLTGQGGEPAPGVVSLAPGTPPAAGPPPGPKVGLAGLVERRVAALPEGSARRAWHAAMWAALLEDDRLALTRAEELVARHPRNLVARYRHLVQAWGHGERGRAADLLDTLVTEAGEALPILRLKRARFLRQEKLYEEARALLTGLRSALPDRAPVPRALARLLDEERWTDARCQALDDALRLRPGWHSVMIDLADCVDDQGYRHRAEALLRAVLDDVPWRLGALDRLQRWARDRGDLEEARALAGRLTRIAPEVAWVWVRLGGTHRRAGDHEAAAAAFRRALEVDPDYPRAWRVLGRLAYIGGDREGAIRSWEESLAREEDQRLARRLEWLKAASPEPWERDIPDGPAIRAVVAGRERVEVHPAADLVDLLDHQVTRLNADGSATDVVTLVMHVVNEDGRDRVTRVRLPSGGRVLVTRAYAVDPDGGRVQASSIRDRRVRFRKLSVGSTVVLQYRHYGRPQRYLTGHLDRRWWFNDRARQRPLSQWVLWLSKKHTLHEHVPPGVARSERAEGADRRVSWTALDVPPAVAEPRMPSWNEVARVMAMTTVPSWDEFLRWEDALLAGAFRRSPEVVALAQGLVGDAPTALDRVRRIHRFLLEEIRYEKDYESRIAGVKPHPAPVVLERRYGDCKDKAVLFLTLARVVGIEAHLALVRTRRRGPILRDLPMQQFNHVIVWIPPQPGIDEGRFFDPTADALDVDALRTDNPGTLALLYDPVRREHAWREVPFQPPAVHAREVEHDLTLVPDGGAEGTTAVTWRGRGAAWFRRKARNPEELAQEVQSMAANLLPGATVRSHEVVEARDLERPAALRLEARVPGLGRREDRDLRVRIPGPTWHRSFFRLERRRHPLVLGVPDLYRYRIRLRPPPGAELVRLPADGAVETECLALRRTARQAEGAVVVELLSESRCERIPAEAYEVYRRRVEDIVRLLGEEVVFRLPE